ncbi:MAG: glycosyltransferase family 1 protein, partial [Anaerolineae bacterium]|nr:glycosyltransferase family 1 protein [Anaerolineae bacterium]
MNIFIMTLGSRGDVQPFVALGKGLQEAGHEVTVCTSSSFEDFIREQGLNYGYMTNEILALLDTDAGKDALENTTNLLEVAKTYMKLAQQAGPIQHEVMNDSWAAAEAADPDLIIYHPKTYGGVHFAQKLDIPAMMVATVPMYVPTSEFHVMGFPNLPLGGGYNKWTYNLVASLTEMGTGRYVKAWREKHNLPPKPKGMDFAHMADRTPVPILHCYSRYIVPPPADWPANAITTGTWFLEHEDNWQPSPELEAFLAAGDPPVYVGFGSMSGRDPQRMAKIVVEALQQADVRGIIATGWGGLQADDLPETIFKLD